jgi:hypothetical protein
MPRTYTCNPIHGTRTRYTNYCCRCEDCTAANALYQKGYAQRPKQRAYHMQYSRDYQFRVKKGVAT